MTTSPRHNVELQSLRGLAALMVLLHHSLRTFDGRGWAWFLSEDVLNAHAAVVLFFVLSGYVLTKSLCARELSLARVGEFYVRRAFRILPALWISIGVGLIYLLVFRRIDAPHMSPWMAQYYDPAQLDSARIFFSLLGLDSHLLPTAWTITVELVASAALPMLAWTISKGVRTTLLLLVVLVALTLSSGVALRLVPLYLVQFALGALLAFPTVISRIPTGRVAAGLALVFLLFFRRLFSWDYHASLPGLVEGLAGMMLIAAVLRERAQWLRAEPLVRLGDWSYSLYLLHLPIALAVTRALSLLEARGLSQQLLPVIVVASTVGLSLPAAKVIYEWVELPGIELGRAASSFVGRRLRRGGVSRVIL